MGKEFEQDVDISVRRRSGYSSIPNKAMSDKRLSIEARGLLALLMTFAEGWVFRAKHLRAECGVGRDKYFRMMREIRDAGYVEIIQHRNEAGKFDKTEWALEDEPGPENPTPVNPDSGNLDHIREINSERENNNKGGDLFGDIEEVVPRKTPASDFGALFEEWWLNDWPKHPRKDSKKACKAKYLALMKGGEIDAPTLSRATRAFVRSIRDMEYLPAPIRFFNQEKYLPFLDAAEESGTNKYRKILERAKT